VLPLRELMQPLVERVTRRNLEEMLELARREEAPLTTPQER